MPDKILQFPPGNAILVIKMEEAEETKKLPFNEHDTQPLKLCVIPGTAMTHADARGTWDWWEKREKG